MKNRTLNRTVNRTLGISILVMVENYVHSMPRVSNGEQSVLVTEKYYSEYVPS